MSGAYTHRPVLLEEAIQGLAIRPDGVYVDGTLGRGGHSEAIVRGLTAGGRLLCIDRDSQALEEGRARLAPWAGQITFLHGNFGDLAALLDGAGVERVDGMLFDLGVSSPQLDDPARGFSYQADAPLDMRMDQGETLTAWTVVNQWPRQELRRVLASMGRSGTPPPLPPPSSGPGRQVPLRPPAPWWRSSGRPAGSRPAGEAASGQTEFSGASGSAVNDELTAISRMLQAAIPRLKTGDGWR